MIIVIGTISYIFINNGSKSIYLKINCGEKNLSNKYKEGDVFECNLSSSNFKIKIEDIKNNKIKLSSSNYGLYPEREDGTISLIDKIKDFELYKGKKLILKLQVTDYSNTITIDWE